MVCCAVGIQMGSFCTNAFHDRHLLPRSKKKARPYTLGALRAASSWRATNRDSRSWRRNIFILRAARAERVVYATPRLTARSAQRSPTSVPEPSLSV